MAPDGYVWWYVDGLSDDGRHGITLIAFLGSVFSPYYAFARRRGSADPLAHCALNVALYGAARRWAMTERGSGQVRRDPSSLAIGPSALEWDGTALTIRIAETTAPLPSRLVGTVRLFPGAVTGREFVLDPDGRHRWWPIAPAARIEVAFDRPNLAWSGAGYFDTNGGDAPLERDFASWHWCRAPLSRGAGIVYEAACHHGPGAALALRCDPNGAVEDMPLPPRAKLPPTRLWRIPRPTRAEAAPSARMTLEDTPFYARTAIATRLFGEPVEGVHESLSLDRFRNPLVQAMLACRIPRRA